MRRWLSWTGLLAVVALAVAGLWSAAAPRPSSATDDARSIASTLRCPTCVAESVADSGAPLAAGMRAVIEEKVAQGQTGDEIRAWFVDRYGDDVLLQPPRRGVGLSLWLLPLVVAPVASWLVVRGRGGQRRTPEAATETTDVDARSEPRRTAAWVAAGAAFAVVAGAWYGFERDEPAGPTPVTETAPAAHPVGVLQAAAEAAPGDAEMRMALGRALDRAERFGDAAEHYLAVVRLMPGDEAALYRAAFALVRADRPGEATPLLERLLDVSPQHAEGLLLLGSIRHDDEDPVAATLLKRFLRTAPDHPAADQARAMLKGDA